MNTHLPLNTDIKLKFNKPFNKHESLCGVYQVRASFPLNTDLLDAYDRLYISMGLPADDYNKDLENDVYVYLIKNDRGSEFYVPSNYVSLAKTDEVHPAYQFKLVFSLSKHPNPRVVTAELMDELCDLIQSRTGLETKCKLGIKQAPKLLTDKESVNLRKLAAKRKKDPELLHTRLKKVLDTNVILVSQVAALTNTLEEYKNK